MQKINIIIAGRPYELNVPTEEEEEILRRVGKQINNMIKEFEASFDVEDKQGALAMCALKLGVNAEVGRLKLEKNIKSSTERLESIHQLLENIEK